MLPIEQSFKQGRVGERGMNGGAAHPHGTEVMDAAAIHPRCCLDQPQKTCNKFTYW